jgi:hypothetical protein
MGKSIYLIALIVTIAIFAVILFSVKYFEDSQFSSLTNDLRQIEFENNLERFYDDFKSFDSNEYCLLTQESISNSTTKLSEMELKIQTYKQSLVSSEYLFTKKNFLLTNALLFERIESALVDCNLDIKPIIYFYAEDNSCEIDCRVMENQLEAIKVACPQVRVFAFPFQSEEFKFTAFFEKKYGVTKPATLIIDGKKIDSLQSNEVLLKEIGCN